MGEGTRLASELAPEHAALIDNLKDQLLIVFLNRLGGTLDIPVAEIDGTGQYLMAMSIDNGVFHFETSKKS